MVAAPISECAQPPPVAVTDPGCRPLHYPQLSLIILFLVDCWPTIMTWVVNSPLHVVACDPFTLRSTSFINIIIPIVLKAVVVFLCTFFFFLLLFLFSF